MEKKNKKSRGLAVLAGLTSITACLLAGTLARYTVSGQANGSARVAKFGVEVSMTDNTAFETSYSPNTDSGTEGGVTATVASLRGDNVVAPGTGEKDTIICSIKGRPEVGVCIQAEMKEKQDIYLKKGSYKDYTVDAEKSNFTLANDYYPVRFILTKAGTDDPVAAGTLDDINNYFKTNVAKDSCDPNTEINETYSISWVYALTGNETADQADTLLGNLSADDKFKTNAKYTPGMTDTDGTFSAVEENTDYSTRVAFSLGISVIQTPYSEASNN